MQIKFPSSFLWGSSLSSYQCEGQNFNTDWYLWEREKGLKEAGKSCNHYDLFEEDFQLARSLNLNCLRISFEWARIFPEKKTVCDKELEHYLKVIDTLLKFNLKPLVTLHHFTNPIWFSKAGGWMESRNIDYFLGYLKKVVEPLKDRVEYWFIFNEPLVYIYNGFLQGIWPPGIKSLNTAKRVLKNIISAYSLGYQEIKNIYRESPIPSKVSLVKHLRIFSPYPNFAWALNCFSSFLRAKFFNFPLLDYLEKKKCLDFLAINYYSKEYVSFNGLFGRECKNITNRERTNSMGWHVYPGGLYQILTKLKKFSLPIIITENGTAEEDDSLYKDYLLSHLRSLALSFHEGIKVAGYLWWSLLDNFEWDKGFKKRFGLVEIDYHNFKRKPRAFSQAYSQICKEGIINL